MDDISELEEMKELADNKTTETINARLKKDGIKFGEDYWKQEKYQKYRTIYIEKENYRFISYDYYIEKAILQQSKTNRYKKGKFDIGTQKVLYSGDVTEDKLFDEILWEYEKNTTIKGVKNKFRDAIDKGGILKQFEAVFGISLVDFNDEQINKLKLMKLLYVFTKTKIFGAKINLYALFSNPTFENVDKTIENDKNRNGEAIAILKNELSKELTMGKIRSYNYSVIHAMNEWEKLIGVAVHYVLEGKSYDLNRLADFLEKNVVDQLWTDNPLIEQNPEMKLFDTVYFKIIQHEFISLRKDFLRISNDTIEKVYKFQTVIKVNSSGSVKVNLLKSYIKSNTDYLAKYVCNDFETTEQAIAFVKNNAKNIEILWEYFLYSYDNNAGNRVPVQLIVAALIALKDASLNNETFTYTYYRAKESGNILILKRLNRKDSTEEVFYRLWAKKVYFIYLCLQGKRKEATDCIRIEDALDKISLFMLYFHNEQDFLFCNDHIFEIIKRSFVPENYALHIWNIVADEIAAKTGYKCLLMHPNVSKLFKMVGDGSNLAPIINGFISVIQMAVNENISKEIKYPLSITMNPSGRQEECFFICKVKQKEKGLEVIQFCEVNSDKNVKRLKRLGFSNMLVDSKADVARVWPELADCWHE